MATEHENNWTRSRAFVFFFAIFFGIVAVVVWFKTTPPNIWGTGAAVGVAALLLACAFWASDEVCEVITIGLFT